MSQFNSIILYVRSASASAAFYQRLLDKAPVEASGTFAMFALDSGVMLGLWGVEGVKPSATAPGGCELVVAVGSRAEVANLHERWQSWGTPIAQPPVDLDFGHTFVALDPDGHRLRVFTPHAA